MVKKHLWNSENFQFYRDFLLKISIGKKGKKKNQTTKPQTAHPPTKKPKQSKTKQNHKTLCK